MSDFLDGLMSYLSQIYVITVLRCDVVEQAVCAKTVS